MDISTWSRKQVGALGEDIACEYLRRHGFQVVARNVARKTGEIDIIAKKAGALHFVEVKALCCMEFPVDRPLLSDDYDPSANLHAEKIRKVARTSEWYVANIGWEGEWQVDGVLVWLRRRDARARARYLPQLL